MSNSYKTIDPTAIHENLHVRVSFLVDFLAFGQSDAEALHIAGPIIRPIIPSIVESVYNKLLSFNITRITFVEDKNIHLPVQEALETVTAGSDRMRYFKGFFGHWLLKIFISDYEDIRTFAYFDRVGIAHVGEASFRHREDRNKYKVDYMYIGLLLGFVTEAVTGNIVNNASVRNEDKVRIIRAFTKVMAIQNDLMSRHYVSPIEHPEEHLLSISRKKPTPSTNALKSTTNSPTCPFSGGSQKGSIPPPSLGMEEFIEAPWSDDSEEEDLQEATDDPEPSASTASNPHHQHSPSDISEELSSIGPTTPPDEADGITLLRDKTHIPRTRRPLLK